MNIDPFKDLSPQIDWDGPFELPPVTLKKTGPRTLQEIVDAGEAETNVDPRAYKECDVCGSISFSDAPFCPACHAYRWVPWNREEIFKRLKEVVENRLKGEEKVWMPERFL